MMKFPKPSPRPKRGSAPGFAAPDSASRKNAKVKPPTVSPRGTASPGKRLLAFLQTASSPSLKAKDKNLRRLNQLEAEKSGAASFEQTEEAVAAAFLTSHTKCKTPRPPRGHKTRLSKSRRKSEESLQEENNASRTLFLQELLQMDSSYATEEEIASILEHCLRIAVRMTGATTGYIMLVNLSDHSLVNEVAISIGKPHECPLVRSFGEGIEGRVAIGKSPLILSQAAGQSQVKPRKGQSASTPDLPGGALCGLCLPIIQRGIQQPQIGLLGVLTLLHHEKERAFTEDQTSSLEMVTEMLSGALGALLQSQDSREQRMAELIEIVEHMENKDNSTRGHSSRVAEICLRIGQRFGLDTDTLRILRTGALLHELGKVRIDDEILLKPGRLTDSEFQILRMYPIYGYELCEPLGLPAETLMLVRNHAERLDGSGYPDRLKMGDIPLPLRILSVADAFDAMSSHRSYRAGMGYRERNEQLNRFAGTQFDPTVVETLKHLANNGDLDELYYSAAALEQMHAA